jgi:N-[(2S)-2-amino-2-carboxyethyl]-L-glutamate dehydrogenase
MHGRSIMVLTGSDVLTLLSGMERDVIETVRAAYEAHSGSESSLPPSTFLRFPNDQTNRIIALPAYLGGEFGTAGIKWISSFPGNLDQGMDRAAAVIILNSVTTGRPHAMLEGSIISAKRTAASAALAARALHGDHQVRSVGIVGCGPINFEIQRFLLSVFPSIKTLYLYDLSREHAEQFKHTCEETFGGIKAEVVADLQTLFGTSSLVSLATTAIHPYISDLSGLAPGSTILHVSLRDLVPEIILSSDNVVDDVEHVCRAQTSIHLAEQLVGTREFIRCTIADVTRGAAPLKKDAKSITVFSPFGLGVLDLAVAEFVYQRAVKEGKGTLIESFLPASWLERADETAFRPASST